MSKENRIWAGRAQLLGDTVSILPLISALKRAHPEKDIVFPIAKKCSQGAPLYLNHPDITEVYITDGLEGAESERDFAKMDSCGFHIEVNPSHPDNRYPREFNIYSESWRMAGFSIEEWDKLMPEQQRPKLYKWWTPVNKFLKGYKTIGIWPQAGYSRENKRNPTQEYWQKLIYKLNDLGYSVVQFGAETDWDFYETPQNASHIMRFNGLSFFDQIKISLECDLCIGTDSGSALILGAYETNMLSLICIHWNNPNNPTALSTNNPNNFSFYSFGGTDNIDQNSVINKIIEKTK